MCIFCQIKEWIKDSKSKPYSIITNKGILYFMDKKTQSYFKDKIIKDNDLTIIADKYCSK